MIKSLIIKSIGTLLNVSAYIAPKYSAKKGFEIFCSPIRLHLKHNQIAFLDTAVNEDIIMSDGNSIRAYTWGNGPKKILFSHGWQSHSFRWINYIKQLTENDDYTVYAFDGPGHGQSGGQYLNIPLYSTYIEEFIKIKGNMNYHVGHSLGGFAILYTFYRLKNQPADGIVLLATPGNAMDFVNQYRDMLKLNEKSYQLLVQYFVDKFEKSPEFFMSDRFVKDLTIKGLIIHDEEDLEAPYHYAKNLSQIWTNSTLITTKDLGHKLRDNKVVEDVIKFIRE